MEVLLTLALKMTELLTKDAQACRVGGGYEVRIANRLQF